MVYVVSFTPTHTSFKYRFVFKMTRFGPLSLQYNLGKHPPTHLSTRVIKVWDPGTPLSRANGQEPFNHTKYIHSIKESSKILGFAIEFAFATNMSLQDIRKW